MWNIFDSWVGCRCTHVPFTPLMLHCLFRFWAGFSDRPTFSSSFLLAPIASTSSIQFLSPSHRAIVSHATTVLWEDVRFYIYDNVTLRRKERERKKACAFIYVHMLHIYATPVQQSLLYSRAWMTVKPLEIFSHEKRRLKSLMHEIKSGRMRWAVFPFL